MEISKSADGSFINGSLELLFYSNLKLDSIGLKDFEITIGDEGPGLLNSFEIEYSSYLPFKKYSFTTPPIGSIEQSSNNLFDIVLQLIGQNQFFLIYLMLDQFIDSSKMVDLVFEVNTFYSPSPSIAINSSDPIDIQIQSFLTQIETIPISASEILWDLFIVHKPVKLTTLNRCKLTT
ncbi:hypothetical protein GYB22_09415 [bacterium]|nr:hypothetical protein [bacterium]